MNKKQLLYTDLDRTLLIEENGILSVSAGNIAAIKNFTESGGYFGIASGRNLDQAKSFLKPILPYINLPFVLSNGTAIFDHVTEELLFSAHIEKAFIEAFLSYYKTRDDFIFVAATYNGYLVIQRPISPKLPEVNFPPIYVTEAELFTYQILKVMAFIKEENFETLIADIKAFVAPFNMNVEPSEKQFIEIIGPTIDKGSGIQQVLKSLPFNDYQLNTIGDFYNDISMLKLADYSAAPRDAAEEVKEIADVIVARHDEDAVSEFISLIVNK